MRILSGFTDIRMTLNFKLNLLRSDLSSFIASGRASNDLENRLVDVESQIWRLEVEKEMMEAGIISFNQYADDGDEQVRDTLKMAMALVTTLNVLGEEIETLKVALESVKKVNEYMDKQQGMLKNALTGTINNQSNSISRETSVGNGHSMIKAATQFLGEVGTISMKAGTEAFLQGNGVAATSQHSLRSAPAATAGDGGLLKVESKTFLSV
jgi:hypothetical protein